MNAYLEILRPSVCVLTIVGLVVGALVASVATLTLPFGLAIIAAFLICGAGNVINDYFDRKIDKTNVPHRPIPSGRVTPKVALAYFALLSAVGIVLAYFVSIYYLGIALFNWLVATAYPWRAKKVPIVKNIFVAYLAASSFLAAGFLLSSLMLTLPLIFLVSIAFVVTLGREIVKDIEDVRGDLRAGIKTLPTLIGEKPAKAAAYALLTIGCIALLLPLYFGLFGIYYLIGAVPAILVCGYSATQNAHKAQKAIKVAMYLAILGFLIGALIS